MTKLYYIAPAEKEFEELKEIAIKIWNTYDDKHGYATEKINQIKDLKNVSDNFMYIVAMFDISNQGKLSIMLSSKTRKAVGDRLKDGGTSDTYNVFRID